MLRRLWQNTFELRIQIPGSPKYLAFVRQVLPSLAGCGIKIPEKSLKRCSFALVEAFDNAIFHAHGGCFSVPVGIGIFLNKKSITIEVTDRGKGFDLKKVKRALSGDTHGRGLLIIKGLMNEVEYKNNVMKMTAHL